MKFPPARLAQAPVSPLRLATPRGSQTGRWASALSTCALVCALAAPCSAHADAEDADSGTGATTERAIKPNSALDAVLFYQLLIGEMQLREGQPGVAFGVLLDAARRTKDEAIFRRAVEIALQARAGDEALRAARAWRLALPGSTEALRTQLQILTALNRVSDAAEPLGALLAQVSAEERLGLIVSLPRFFQRVGDPRAAATLMEQALKAYATEPALRTAVPVTVARGWLAAGDSDRALSIVRAAAAQDPAASGPPLVALQLMAREPQAEAVVKDYLARPDAEPSLRLAYARTLTQAQRLAEAISQFEAVTRAQPDQAPAWLALGALYLDMRQPQPAEAALLRHVQLVEKTPAVAPSAAVASGDDDEEGTVAAPGDGLVPAWLLLAQAAEQRGDFPAAEKYLARVDNPQQALEVQTRRAILLARQGRVADARALVRQVPERQPTDARAKAVAEAQVVREVKQWALAHEILKAAVQRWPEDSELLYELAMMAEKLNRLDEMEQLLRQVITLKPDQQHAYNALGYSLADRGLRLQEARDLIRKALSFTPGDPFITDSLGWVEFRLGNLPEALQLLKQAYAARPDTEIAAHLGEVLWAMGEKDEARRVFREGRKRDDTNEVLRETLARLKPGL